MGSLMLGLDGSLYGITYTGGSAAAGEGGTIYKLHGDGSGYTILHTFSTNDTADFAPGVLTVPGLSVAQGIGGTLYGTTAHGGTNGKGTVFKLNPDGSDYTILQSFDSINSGPSRLIQGQDGALYGTGSGFVFKLNSNGSGFTILHTFGDSPDGFGAIGKMIQGQDGALYGTTYSGGTSNLGTVFKLDTNGGNYSVLHSFTGPPDGSSPFAGLMQGNDGALYGTTRSGGTTNIGSVFKLNTDGGGYTQLYSFTNAPDGSAPTGTLVQGPSNVIYGTTVAGGVGGRGTFFKINPDGSGYVQLYIFGAFPDGRSPQSELAAGVFTGNTGVIYGTTQQGGEGAVPAGTVFAFLINPPLSITPVSGQSPNNQTVVFWPSWALDFELQTTTNLESGTWTTVSNAVPVTGVQLTNGLAPAYFRLIRQ